MLAVLPFWPSVYNKLGTDGDRRVRELAHASLALVVPAVGKALTPHLKAGVANFPKYRTIQPGLRIRIHLIRIRIQHCRLNTDPDPIKGFDDQNFKNITDGKKFSLCFIKNLNLPIPRPP
jgi:hypothetical protein